MLVARRQRLAVVAGHLAGLAGSLAFDLRQESKATAYFTVALQAADDVASPDLAAWALATRSLIPSYSGDHSAALRLLHEPRTALTATSATAGSPGWRRWKPRHMPAWATLLAV